MNLIPDVKIQMGLGNKKNKAGLLDEVTKTLKSLPQEKLEKIGFTVLDNANSIKVFYKNKMQFTGITYESAFNGIILEIANRKNGLDQINSIMKQAISLSK